MSATTVTRTKLGDPGKYELLVGSKKVLFSPKGAVFIEGTVFTERYFFSPKKVLSLRAWSGETL